MAKLKSFLSHIFESKWTYNDGHTVRVHKKMGQIEYAWPDPWGYSWEDEPMPGE